jgi:glutamate-1-semialdehyde 2,1-aminomutase
MPTNAELFARASRSIPGGVNSPVRAFRSVGGTPRFVARAQGPYFWDAEDKRYIDYIGSWGSTAYLTVPPPRQRLKSPKC